MNDSEKNKKLEYELQSLISNFNPFGYRDLEVAMSTGINVGYDSDKIYEILEDFCKDAGSQMSEIDPVYCVYDYILQQARNEIDEKLTYDICNDSNVYVYGNFMCTNLDDYENCKEDLIEKIAENDMNLDDFDEPETKWFFDEIELSQDDIDKKKLELKAEEND